MTDDVLWPSGGQQPKLRLLADEDLAAELVADVARAGISVISAAAAGVAGRPDRDVLERATRLGRVLLTQDKRGPWMRRGPLELRKAGVIVLLPAGVSAARTALGFVLGTFALRFGSWRGATILAGSDEFRLLSQGSAGKPTVHRFRLVGRVLMAREEGEELTPDPPKLRLSGSVEGRNGRLAD